MSLLRWIWAYLFDCVHSHTTWPHQDRFGHAYVCCIDCGREMPYSVEYMQIISQDRKRNILDSRFPATASLIIAGALLLLTPSYALAKTTRPLADQNQSRRHEPAGHSDGFPSKGTGCRCLCTRCSIAKPLLPLPAFPSTPARVARPGLQPFSQQSRRHRLYKQGMSDVG